MLIFAGGDDDRRLTLVDRVTGTGRPLTEKPDIYGAPRYSPDGKKLAFIRGPWPKTELWVHDLAANTQIRLVEGVPFWNLHPAWSPDGKRIAFTSGRKGTDATVVATGAAAEALWWQVADGSAGPEPLASSRESLNEVAFTPDGNTIVFRQGSAPHSLAYRAVRGDTTIIPLVTSPYLKYHPTISPDGKWLAYTSYETGEPRVYVRAFPAPASKWPVSDGAGMEPRWAPDGHAIYYRTRDKMMTAHVTMAPTFTVTSRDTLFADRFVRSFNHRGFDISPDGKTFVMISSIAADSALTVIVNWRTTLRARLPAK
jgi:Tol biopolymer transport system component